MRILVITGGLRSTMYNLFADLLIGIVVVSVMIIVLLAVTVHDIKLYAYVGINVLVNSVVGGCNI